MAKNLKYTVPFVSLTGLAYEARIYVDGWTGTSTTLMAGPSPFSTEESGDDWLQPIAMQTGYLRIVCAESAWRNLVPTSPTSHFVTLVERGDDTPVWQGYIQYETYTHALYCGTDVYEFPLCSALSLLENEHLEWSSNRITFAALIAEILGKVDEDAHWNEICFSSNLSEEAAPSTDLACAVSLVQFFEVEERLEWNGVISYTKDYYEPAKSCLEILEEICKFWGWTLHEVGTSLYFCTPDESADWRVATMEDLPQLVRQSTLPTRTRTPVDYTRLQWKSTDHNISTTNPVKKITIEGDAKGDEEVIEVDIEKIAQFTNLPNYQELAHGKYYAQCLGLTRFTNWRNGGVVTTYTGAEGTNAAAFAILITSGYEDCYGPVFRKSDTWAQSEDAGKTKYNWKQDIFLGTVKDSPDDVDGTAELMFATTRQYLCSDCALVISADVQSPTDMTATSTHLEMMATIGNYHWDGTQWHEHGQEWRGVWFPVYIGDDRNRPNPTKSGSIVTTLNYRTPYQGAEGYGMPVTTPMLGVISISIRWMQYNPNNTMLIRTAQLYSLSNLKVKLVPAVDTTTGVKPQDRNTYSADGTGMGEDALELAFVTKNNNIVAPQLVSLENAWLQTLSWSDGTTDIPEEHLLARMTRLKGSGATEWREIDIDNADATSIAPYEEGSTQLLPVRVCREWGDGSAHVLLGKLL